MYNTNILDALIIAAPDKSIYQIPMSKSARELLCTILKHGTAWSRNLGGPSILLAQYGEQYNPIVYENAISEFNLNKYSSLIKGLKPKSIADIISIMNLNNLSNMEWVHDNIDYRSPRLGTFSSQEEISMYRWITKYFLFTDFPDSEIPKILELGKSHAIDVVRQEAINIQDPTKHSAAYLYAVVSSNASKVKNARIREDIKVSKYSDKLINVFKSIEGNKVTRKIDDTIVDKWASIRDFINILRDQDK